MHSCQLSMKFNYHARFSSFAPDMCLYLHYFFTACRCDFHPPLILYNVRCAVNTNWKGVFKCKESNLVKFIEHNLDARIMFLAHTLHSDDFCHKHPNDAQFIAALQYILSGDTQCYNNIWYLNLTSGNFYWKDILCCIRYLYEL